MKTRQVFDGPISESIPSSVVSFAHRRNRQDSTVSFTYFQDDDDDFVEWVDEDAVDGEGDEDDLDLHDVDESAEDSRRLSMVSKRTSRSRDSIEHPLLSRYHSTGSYARDRKVGSRLNQRIYIESEDLTAVISGFSTSVAGFVVYLFLSISTFGFAYLLFRWLPKWRIRLIGKPSPFRRCQWVAIEVSGICSPKVER